MVTTAGGCGCVVVQQQQTLLGSCMGPRSKFLPTKCPLHFTLTSSNDFERPLKERQRRNSKAVNRSRHMSAGIGCSPMPLPLLQAPAHSSAFIAATPGHTCNSANNATQRGLLTGDILRRAFGAFWQGPHDPKAAHAEASGALHALPQQRTIAELVDVKRDLHACSSSPQGHALRISSVRRLMGLREIPPPLSIPQERRLPPTRGDGYHTTVTCILVYPTEIFLRRL